MLRLRRRVLGRDVVLLGFLDPGVLLLLRLRVRLGLDNHGVLLRVRVQAGRADVEYAA